MPTRCGHSGTGNFANDADGEAITIRWGLWRDGAIAALATDSEPDPETRPTITQKCLRRYDISFKDFSHRPSPLGYGGNSFMTPVDRNCAARQMTDEAF